jgi:hypothetical protein
MNRVGGRNIDRDDRMPALVIGGQHFLLFSHDHRAALRAHHDLIFRILELGHGDDALAASCREQRCLVDEIHEIGAGKTWSPARDRLQLDVRRERNIADMHLEDVLAADDVGIRYHDLAVEAARAQKRRIEHIGTVRRRDQDDAHIGANSA